GAFMAVQMAYRNSGIFPRGVIALDGYYLNDASFGKIGKDDIYSASPPLIWINTPDTRRIIAPGCESPQPLIDAGVNVSKINLKNTDYALAKGNMRHILWAMGETGIRPRKKER
ncbi:MAG: hypothetical protein FWF34_03280, partial [Alphaproteobacteria bacterium]|nr:hypothetical protein [Alphaproteobacteria bacterium]